MRATNERRRAQSRGHVVPTLPPAKHREAGSTYWLVEEVKLHPDHYISVARAQSLGLVTRKQIARAFGVTAHTVSGWANRNTGFPARVARLEVLPCAWGEGPNYPEYLYSAAEIIEWAESYRPARLARIRLTHKTD